MTASTFRDFWAQQYATQGQYFFTRVISQRMGAVFAYIAYRIGATPNLVTLLGLVVMVGASCCLALSSKFEFLNTVALVMYQLGFALDCADGQLARATRRASEFGAWLDVACDHIRQTSLLIALGAVLLASSALAGGMIALALFLFGSGLAMVLHTASTLRGGTYQPHGLSGIGDYTKLFVKTLCDTPFVLLLLCVLASAPKLLVVYISLIGVMNLVQATALGVLRIKSSR